MSTTSHPCRVCSHPDREAIDQAILNGKSLRDIARTFRIGSYMDEPGDERHKPDHKIVARHVDQCMGEAYRAAKADEVEASGRAMIDRLGHLDEVIDEQMERLRAGTVLYDGDAPKLHPDGSPVTAYDEAGIARSVREARRNLELRSRLAGVNPEGDPDAADDARALLSSPEARARVAELEGFLAGADAARKGQVPRGR